jgi:hypothetical protein
LRYFKSLLVGLVSTIVTIAAYNGFSILSWYLNGTDFTFRVFHPEMAPLLAVAFFGSTLWMVIATSRQAQSV